MYSSLPSFTQYNISEMHPFARYIYNLSLLLIIFPLYEYTKFDYPYPNGKHLVILIFGLL